MQAGKRYLKGSTLKTEMKTVLFHPEAEEEMIASAVFYETRSNGLGHKFLNEIARSLDLISSLDEPVIRLQGIMNSKMISQSPCPYCKLDKFYSFSPMAV